jgi:hypothetical protein
MVGGMSRDEMKSALHQKFGVANDKELLKSGNFQMATSGSAVKAADLKNPEKVAQLYRNQVGIIKNDPVNQPGVKGVVNGINVIKYNRPWDAFGINPRDSKYDGASGSATLTADVKSAYRKLSLKHHPDHGGDRDTMERLTTFKNSLTATF